MTWFWWRDQVWSTHTLVVSFSCQQLEYKISQIGNHGDALFSIMNSTFIHLFIHSFILSFCLSYHSLFIHSFPPSFLPSFIHSLIHSFTHSCKRSSAGETKVQFNLYVCNVFEICRSKLRFLYRLRCDNEPNPPLQWIHNKSCGIKNHGKGQTLLMAMDSITSIIWVYQINPSR